MSLYIAPQLHAVVLLFFLLLQDKALQQMVASHVLPLHSSHKAMRLFFQEKWLEAKKKRNIKMLKQQVVKCQKIY